jgi:class 3 adenylate cyclase/CHASE2 domain-containing sensor protein
MRGERLSKSLLSNLWLMGTVTGLLSAGLWWAGVWDPLEHLGYNLLFQSRQIGILPSITWDRCLAVIAIDDKSLKAYGRFQSWRRDRYSQLLERLAAAPPLAIGFDLILSEPSADDQRLAQAMQLHGNVVLAVGVGNVGRKALALAVVPELAEVARLGHIVAPRVDADGISRQAPPLFVQDWPAFSLAVLQAYNQTLETTFEGNTETPRDRPASLPQAEDLTQAAPLWLNWPNSAAQLPTYSFVDVAQGKVDPRLLAGKIVLVGVTATGIDALRSPYNPDPPTAGIYLHAAAIDNLLGHRFLSRLPEGGTLLLLLVLAPLTTRLLKNLSWQGRLLALGSLLLAWCAIALVSFAFFEWWLPTLAPLGTILLAGASLQLREQYEKQQLMRLFAQHVSPEMAEVIWQHKTEIFSEGHLEPQELMSTVLFVDIRGFTAISESMSPRELLDWLNRYLDLMARCLMEHGGVVDKYIGDAIMAIFGVPFPKTQASEIREDALKAIAASLAMHERLDTLNQHLQAEGKPSITIGIGIHTGLVVAGSVGGAMRLNYSAIGDTVNVAARLESMNKEITWERPYQILISDRTLTYIGDRYLSQEVGSFHLRGKVSETKVYTILGEKSED